MQYAVLPTDGITCLSVTVLATLHHVNLSVTVLAT